MKWFIPLSIIKSNVEILDLSIIYSGKQSIYLPTYVYLIKKNNEFFVSNSMNFLRFLTFQELSDWFINYFKDKNFTIIQEGPCKTLYNSDDGYIKIVQKIYRKYRIKTAFVRNQLIMKGLAEYWYHPSKLSFDF
jgi:hypothetical protein